MESKRRFVRRSQFVGHTDRVEFLSIADYSNASAGIIQKPFLCVSGGRDNTVRVWDLERSRETRKMYVFDAVTSGAVDWQSATIAVGSRSGALGLWDLNTGQKRASIRGHQNDVTCVISYNEPSLDGAGLFVSGGADGVVKVWDPRQEVAAATMTGHRPRFFRMRRTSRGYFCRRFLLFRENARVSETVRETSLFTKRTQNRWVRSTHFRIRVLLFTKRHAEKRDESKKFAKRPTSWVLVSTAAYFPPSQKSRETPLSKAVSNIASTLLLRKTSANASSDHHKDDLPVLETVNSGQSQTSNLSSVRIWMSPITTTMATTTLLGTPTILTPPTRAFRSLPRPMRRRQQASASPALSSSNAKRAKSS